MTDVFQHSTRNNGVSNTDSFIYSEHKLNKRSLIKKTSNFYCIAHSVSIETICCRYNKLVDFSHFQLIHKNKLRKIIRRKRRSIYPQLQKIMFVKSVGY